MYTFFIIIIFIGTLWHIVQNIYSFADNVRTTPSDVSKD